MTELTAVVTGAARGIGAAVAKRLAIGTGTVVHLVDVDQSGLDDTVSAIAAVGGSATSHRFSVDDEHSWAELARGIGRLDVLVNNAYWADVRPITEQTVPGWERQFDVNVVGLFLAIRALEAPLRRAAGAIVNVASVHGFVGVPGYSAYAASKGAVLALTRQLAVELAPDIRVNAVVPGPVLTAAWDGITEEDHRRSAHATAMLRLGRPEEVASAVAFLAGADASFITGASLAVDGGWLVKKDSV